MAASVPFSRERSAWASTVSMPTFCGACLR